MGGHLPGDRSQVIRTYRQGPVQAPSGGPPRRRLRLSRAEAFWAVAGGFLTLFAFSTAPGPLYGLYQQQDHLSSLTVTIVYAVYATGIVASLLLVGHVSDWYGRKPVLIPALMLGLVSAAIFAASASLPALVIGRVLNGLAIGAAVATGTAYIADLDAEPGGVPSRKSEIVATVAQIGGLAIGPLLVGLFAQYLPDKLSLSYLIFVGAFVVSIVALIASPEGRAPIIPRPRYHPQRLSVPPGSRGRFTAAATSAFLCFAALGLFAGLTGTFLAGPLHHRSEFLTGLTIFITFGSGAVAQVMTSAWQLRRLISAGIVSMLSGLVVVVLAAWLSPPSLALFVIGGGVIGTGCGLLFRGGLTVTVSAAPADQRAGLLAAFFVTAYVGLSLPVVGLGIALQYVSPKVVLLAFGAIVAVGTLAASPVLFASLRGPGSAAGRSVRPL